MPIERARPNLKIQDGCDHRCSYCIVWRARGPSRSLAASKVEAEVSALSQRGFGEVVLCGVNLGAYGSEGLDLAGLLERLLERTPVGRLRLSSIEPQDVSSRLLEVMASSGGRIAPYLALPLQSGCDRTLRRMGRPCPTAAYAERVAEARSLMPAVAVAADFICGFPGETDRDWAESLDFCRRMGFAAMHVFRYSPRPGTVAATLPDPVAAPIARARSAEARALRDALREHYVASLLGTPQRVLVESAGWGTTGGLVRARVDEALPRDALVDLPARALLAPDTLDCRP